MSRIWKYLIAILMAILIAWGACSACLVVYALVRGQPKATKFWFSDFYVCEGANPVTGLPQEPRSAWPPTAEKIYICGHFVTDGKVNLRYLLMYEDEPTGWFLLNRQYQTGYVFEEIPPSIWRFPASLGLGADDHNSPQRRPGHYRVEVWQGRRMCVSTEFTIVDEPNP
jgi:hypothetical protein